MFGRKSTTKYGCNLRKPVSPHVPLRTNSLRDLKSRVESTEVSWTELCATKKTSSFAKKSCRPSPVGETFSPWSSVKVYGCKKQDGVFFYHPRMLAQWGWRNPHLRMTVIARMFRFRFGVSYKSSTCRSYSEDFFQPPKVSQIDTVIGYNINILLSQMTMR